MKKSSLPQSATSLPRAPRDDSGARFAKYTIMMGIRIACFIAMVLVTPYGWYTWVFAAGAIFLPYLAVVVANVGQESKAPPAQSPERMLDTTPAPDAPPVRPADTGPRVIRIDELRTEDRPPQDDARPGDTPS